MATTFDITTYPLETSTAFKPGLGTRVDRLSDGTVKLRQLTSIKPITIECVFTPMTETESAAFETYLNTYAATEFDLTHNGKTYRGFIDGNSVEKAVSDGYVHWWSFSFEGIAV